MHREPVLVCHQFLLLYLALQVLLLAVPGYGCEQPDAFARADTTQAYSARFQSLLDTAVRGGLPGVSLRVNGPGVDFQGAAGVADLTTGEALTTKHAMYMASLGKTFTAAIALQLCDEGRLALEAPIANWLPDEVSRRIPASGNITLRQLLSHTSGIMDYMNDAKAWTTDFASDPHRQWTHNDVVPYLYDRPLLFEPGTNYHYSNSNYILVGLIIEQVTGQPGHTLISKRILAPLGLQHTFNGDVTVSSEKRAHGYIKWRGRIIDTYPWYSHYGLADSGIHSTPGELSLFIEALFNTEEILSESMRMQMTSVSASGRPPSDYGLGIYVQHNPWGAGQRWYSHDGIDPGYQADMLYLPELDLAIVLAANASMGKANFIYEKLITAVVKAALDTSFKGVGNK